MIKKNFLTFPNFENIRKDFTILSKKIYGNKQLCYLDNAASTQKPECVINSMNDVYRKLYANVHRGDYYIATAITELYEKSRLIIKNFLNAPSTDNIIFTSNGTSAINTVAYGWGMKHLKKDDEIIVTIMEHHSNLVPWYFIKEIKGIKLIFLLIDKYGIIHIEDFCKIINKKTRLLAITQMSNILGTIPPIREIIKIAHINNIKVLVDGAQGAVHLPVDVQKINCDWYTMTGHKIYGPTGIGVLYGKRERLEEMQPFLGGGEMVNTVTINSITYKRIPYKFEAGTPPIVEAIGLGEAIKYIENIGRDILINYENDLSKYAKKRLLEINGIRIIGNAPEKGCIISFILSNIHAHDLSIFLDHCGVAIRAGNHCAQQLLTYFKLTSICRISLSFYNSYKDIDQCIDGINKAKYFFQSGKLK